MLLKKSFHLPKSSCEFIFFCGAFVRMSKIFLIPVSSKWSRSIVVLVRDFLFPSLGTCFCSIHNSHTHTLTGCNKFSFSLLWIRNKPMQKVLSMFLSLIFGLVFFSLSIRASKQANNEILFKLNMNLVARFSVVIRLYNQAELESKLASQNFALRPSRTTTIIKSIHCKHIKTRNCLSIYSNRKVMKLF